MKFPTINIVQKWIKKNNHTFNGNIKCSFIDFDLNIEIKKNDTVYIDIESKINRINRRRGPRGKRKIKG